MGYLVLVWRAGGPPHLDSTYGIEAAEDGGGGSALFDGVGGGFGDFFEEGDGGGAGFEGAEGKGLVGEGLEFGEVGLDGGGAGELDEFEGVEFVVLGEGDEVVAEDEEGGEEFGLAVGEGRGGRGNTGLRTEC